MRTIKNQVVGPIVLVLIATLAQFGQDCAKRNDENLCVQNLVRIRVQLSNWGWNGAALPKSLSPLSKVLTNSDVFVCPASGHEAGVITNIDDWTDYIYFVSIDDSGPPDVPLLICPPENHGGQFGNAIWRDGNRSRLTAAEARKLVAEPWEMAKSADTAEIEEIKRSVTVHIPKRLKAEYSNPYIPPSE